MSDSVLEPFGIDKASATEKQLPKIDINAVVETAHWSDHSLGLNRHRSARFSGAAASLASFATTGTVEFNRALMRNNLPKPIQTAVGTGSGRGINKAMSSVSDLDWGDSASRGAGDDWPTPGESRNGGKIIGLGRGVSPADPRLRKE